MAFTKDTSKQAEDTRQMAKKLRYSPPRTQAARIAEAEGHIRDITRSMNQGANRFGSYGQSCRDGIRGWEATITDAKAKIAAGVVKA
jgi:hypothetical protein